MFILVVKTLDIELSQLVFNAFYIVLCVQRNPIQANSSLEKFKDYYSKKWDLLPIIQEFGDFCKIEGYELNTFLDK